MTRKNTFIGIVVMLMAAGFLLTSFAGFEVARKSMREQLSETTLPLTSDTIYSEIQRDLLRPIFISSLMAHDTFLRDWKLAGEQEPDAMVRYLAEIQKRFGTVTSFFVSERTRRYYHSSGVLKTVKADDAADGWYFRVRALDKPYEINVDWDTADRTSLTIFINYRVLDYDGNFIGVTGVGLAVNAVQNLIASYQERFDRDIYFVDRSAQVTLAGQHYDGPENLRSDADRAAVADHLLSGDEGSYQFESQGETVFLNSRYVPEFQWYLLVEQHGEPAGPELTRTLLINLGVSAAVLIIVLLIANFTLGSYQRRLETMASTDKLTGLANRQTFDVVLGHEMKSMERTGKPLSALLFDLDHFKHINDTFGHLGGDAVLQAVSARAKSRLRASDLLCRWGGEEFLALLPDCPLERAIEIAESLRASIGEAQVEHGAKATTVTASIGVGEAKMGESEQAFVSRLDRALYRAKQNGRDRVEGG
ncbi:MAG: sensor domain-containing diguanylate cyclase [Rhodospirillales bacterium]